MEDPGSVQNENGQTELKPKRRISSILKAPRSPLTSIGPINDKVKECPTKPVEKKQRKSRRVSFAETTGVKVFEKDATEITLLNNAAKEVEGEQQKMDAVQDVKRQISGMETLLHAPIQVSQQQFGENYNEQVNIERTTGDRTIVFSGDDNEDMDMTYSHTVLINENPTSNENPSSSKTGKVDFKDFLSRLNAAKKTDEQLKITKNQNVHRQTSDMEAFICDSNPVTLQKFEKNCNDQFNLQRTMGDKTIVFSSDNNEDMNVTRSHTVLTDENYDKRKSRASTSVKLDFRTLISGVKTSEEDNLSGRRQAGTPYSSSEDQALSGKALAENKSQFTGFLSSINPNGQSASVNLNGPIDNLPVIQPNPPSLKVGKVDFKDFLSRLNAGKSTTAKENSFAASTEMFGFDLDKPWVNNANSSLPTNTDSLGVNFFPEKRNVLFEELDMEITKSHTAAIDDNFMRQLTGQQEDFTGHQRPCSLQPSMSLFPTDQELKRSSTVSKKSVNQALSESVPGSSFLFPKDQTIVFAGDDNMDMTRSHTVAIDSQSLQHNMTGQRVFGTGREICCESGKSLKTSSTVENRTERSELGLNLSKSITTHYSQPDEQDDMEMTKSQIVAIDYKDIEANNQQMESTRTSRKSVSGLCSIPGDKTVVFRDEQDDMEMTRSQTVAIDYKDVEAVSNPITWTSRSVGAPVMSLPTDKTVVFSEELDDMDMTKSHTVAIDSRSLLQTSNGGKMDCKNMEAVNPLMGIPRKPRKSVGGLFSLPADKTVMFTEEQDDMDMTKSLTVAIDYKTIEAVNPLKEFTRKSRRSVAGLTFPVVKTVVFTEKHDDMDMTKSHTVAIDRKHFMQASGVFSESKSMSKSGQNSALVCDEQDDMEMTRSQTVAIDYKNIEAVNVLAVSPSKRGTPGTIPINKTVVFSEELDDMDMTKCHTMAIDSTSLLQTSTGAKMDCKNMEAVNPLMEICRKPRKSVGGLFSLPAGKTVMFAEEQDDMEMTRSQTVAIDYKDVEAVSNPITWTSRSVGAPVMSLPTDKTVVFSEELDDMDMTKCHTVAIDSRGLLQTSSGGKMDYKNIEAVNPQMGVTGKPKKSMTGLFFLPADKTVMFAEEHDDMDMTKSHTAAIDSRGLSESSSKEKIDCKNLETVNPLFGTRKSRKGVAGICSLPADRTVMFAEEHDDMDMTKSHTAAIDSRGLSESSSKEKIDCKNLETVNPLFGTRKSRKGVAGICSLPADRTVMFAEENDDMDMTKSHTVAIDSKSNLQASNKETTVLDSTLSLCKSDLSAVLLSDEQEDMEITRSKTVAIDYKTIDLNCELGMGISRKSAGLASHPSDKTVVFSGEENDMEITKSHTVAVDGSSFEASAKQNLIMPNKPGRASSLQINWISQNKKTENEMEMTRSHTVCIDDQLPMETRGIYSVASSSDNRTVVFSSEQDDMDITRSNTVAIDSKDLQTTKNVRESVLTASNEQNIVFSGGENMSANRGIGGSNDNSAHLNNKKKYFDPEKQEAEVVDSKDKIDAAHVSNQTAKLKRKSVSFRFPEHEFDSEREVKIICTAPTTELNSLNTIPLENTESFRCQTLNKELTETVHVDKASENLNMGNDDEHAPHQPPMVESDGNKSMQKTSSCEESIFTGEEPLLVATKARRRSLADIHSKLKSIRKIYEECPEKEMSSHTAPLPLQVIELKPENTDRKNEDALSNKSCRNENKSFADKSELMEEAPEEPRDQPLESSFVLGDQTRNMTTPVNFSKETPQTKRVSLGVFRPKLPNKKRPHSSEGFLDGSNPTKLTGYHLFGKHLSKTAGLGALEDASRPQSTFSLVENLHEEILPEFNDEMDSAESLNSEFPTSCYDETKPMEELQKKSNTEDLFFDCPEPVGTRGQKRPLPEDSSEDKMLIESTEKRRSQDGVSSNREQVTKYTSQWDSNGEGIAAENPPSMLAKTLDSTNSSSNTLNFTKCDSTFGDLSEQRYSQMESQFLNGDRYEHNLREKCLDGSITVKEFLQVLGVNILIQRPRQSQLPPKFAADAAPTPEDWLNEMYIYRPQLKVYEEDCQALYETIEKLKKQNCDQEKSLRSLNEPLWKMVKTYSEEQLRSLGSMLNERKSDFRRKSKMLSHERKVGLYSKLLQSAQSEQKKLEDKITMTDKLLSDLDECMSSLEAEATNMDLFEVEDDDHSISELELAVKAMEEEFEHLKTHEANIEREQLNLYSEQKNMKSKLCKLQEKKRQLEMSIQELSSLAEWTLSEWLDERAVFTFLNGSLELELIFGEPVDGVQFNGKPGKKILDIKVYTLLDDEAAPSSSLVAHKLITQFIESKVSLCQKYTTQQDLQKLLLDISLVVCRCRLLGEELHYLQKNGPAKFEILEMVILNTDIKIIFSSFKAFAKFEITLSLTPVYPASRLHLSSFNNYIGNASCDQVEQIISTVKPANSYLTRIVEKIHQNLLTKEHPWNTVC
ncbi:kinetochore scaffold 1-like [Acipenser ruthenus]|uniref:kinetochore scaffold 1-like n=1 Tax=Acipenser ruthenus TaxID=7906 RepID=UPI0027416AE6|nr:kinetochore scaffold 1-like [Acipenser ruthenus]XP_058847374.1 kinetochore scaffold 1-like [Acipenser ruthenus]XP_058847375.1 kinetochore scaffold 1-like [Acipenser ruthenus]XP_058847376.1 kinetochore scaffold 1-like [Acipenser ruthenus]